MKKQRVHEGLTVHAMMGAAEEGGLQNEWVSRFEIDLLKRLTGLPVTAARIHRAPRKRMQKPPKMISRARLSILLGEDTGDIFVLRQQSRFCTRYRIPQFYRSPLLRTGCTG